MLRAKKVGLRTATGLTARHRTCVDSVSIRSRFKDATFLSGTGEVSQEPRANSGNLWILWIFYGYLMDMLWTFCVLIIDKHFDKMRLLPHFH